MGAQKICPTVLFDRDTPTATFNILLGGEPFRMLNYEPTLYVVDPEGTVVASALLEVGGVGELNLPLYCACALFDQLDADVQYTAQIYLKTTNPVGGDIGLLDIIDPYWLDYVPPVDHVPGWFSGEETRSRTVLTVLPWDTRESYRTRGD